MAMEICFDEKNKLAIYTERPATKAERKKDKYARVMAIWVRVDFSGLKPKVDVDCTLCA